MSVSKTSTDDELHVVTITEFRERSEELTREVHDTGEAVFITDGEVLLARLVPAEVSLEQIRDGLKAFDEIQRWSDGLDTLAGADEQRNTHDHR